MDNKRVADQAIDLAREVLKEETCDKCGSPFDPLVKRELSAVLKFDFGYFSNRDGDDKLLILCNNCAEKLYDTIIG